VTGGPDPDELPRILGEAAEAIERALAVTADWGLAGTVEGQHQSDLAADAAATEVLVAAGVGVFSEESGSHHPERPVTVVLDPLDGSTNAFRGLPWYAASLCAVDADGPLAALVLDLVHGTRFEARRGAGATRDGEPIRAGGTTELADAIVAVNGLPDHHWGWAQFRALGAAALDLCAVAEGRLDGFVDCTDDGLAPWDYLGGLLVCREAGAVVEEAGGGDDLVSLDRGERRPLVAAATRALADALHAARNRTGAERARP
jgi:fructose-1,6-bisphosphatase/inositol monophosphatase family enzyme